ncbi:hypothetical protein K9L63_00470 [Candidatus Gracilibacteria bacterium]|nr:hypothetical protein [Candidatus Gracilibacteria bacterium]
MKKLLSAFGFLLFMPNRTLAVLAHHPENAEGMTTAPNNMVDMISIMQQMPAEMQETCMQMMRIGQGNFMHPFGNWSATSWHFVIFPLFWLLFLALATFVIRKVWDLSGRKK